MPRARRLQGHITQRRQKQCTIDWVRVLVGTIIGSRTRAAIEITFFLCPKLFLNDGAP